MELWGGGARRTPEDCPFLGGTNLARCWSQTHAEAPGRCKRLQLARSVFIPACKVYSDLDSHTEGALHNLRGPSLCRPGGGQRALAVSAARFGPRVPEQCIRKTKFLT